jgi:sugar phosphate isomerase/epimerase
MTISLHGLTTMHCNLRTDVRIARETGHPGLEILAPKLLRFLDAGGTAKELSVLLRDAGVAPTCINALPDVETPDPARFERVLVDAERLCAAAETIGCPTVQLLPLCGLEGRAWPEVRRLTAANLARVAAVGLRHGVRFQLEPVAWSPVHSLAAALAVREAAGSANVGVVIDFWHLAAGGETVPADVAALDASLIYGVHFCDGFLHRPGTPWNEGALRGCLPGDGEVPVPAWVKAVRATGYDGAWSCELYSPRHWEADPWEVARECRARMERALA